LKVKITPIRTVNIFGIDERSLPNIAWCATANHADHLFWVGGYLICLEPYEKSLECDEDKGVLPIGQLCYAKFPKYVKSYEVEKSLQIPIVDVSDMGLYKEIADAIEKHQTRTHRRKRADANVREGIN
jgi:hypothetical protein